MPRTFIYPFVNGGGVYRPLIPIIIINPLDKSSTKVMALLDTGADDCVFPQFIASSTNHNLKGEGVVSSITQGVGQTKVETWKHTFIIGLLDPNDKTTILWKSKEKLIGCLDHDSAPPLLGFESFLSNFKITFNYPTKRILIEIQ